MILIAENRKKLLTVSMSTVDLKVTGMELKPSGRIILKWIFERLGVGAQTGFIWLKIGTGGGLL
jgi:hypothetical protein